MTCEATTIKLYDEIVNALFLFTLGTIYGLLILSQNNTEHIPYMLHILEPLIAVLIEMVDFSIYISAQSLSVKTNKIFVVFGSASNSSNFN